MFSSVCLFPFVRVNKEVAADSKEARSYLKSKNTKQENEDDESQTPKSKSFAGPRYAHYNT